MGRSLTHPRASSDRIQKLRFQQHQHRKASFLYGQSFMSSCCEGRGQCSEFAGLLGRRDAKFCNHHCSWLKAYYSVDGEKDALFFFFLLHSFTDCSFNDDWLICSSFNVDWLICGWRLTMQVFNVVMIRWMMMTMMRSGSGIRMRWHDTWCDDRFRVEWVSLSQLVFCTRK